VGYIFVAFDLCVVIYDCGIEVTREWRLEATMAGKTLSLSFLTLFASLTGEGEQRDEVSRAHPGEFIGEVLKATVKKVAIVDASWH